MRGQDYQHCAGYWSIFLLVEFAVLNNGHTSFSATDVYEQNTAMDLKQNERQVLTNKASDCLANILKETEVQQCRKLTSLENQQVTLCNSTEEQQLYQFWESQPLVRYLYTLLSAVLYSVNDCPGMAGNRLEEAVNDMGCELVSEILKEISFLYEEFHLVGDLKTCCTVWRKPAVLSQTMVITRELFKGMHTSSITEVELKRSLVRDALIKTCSFIKNSPSPRPLDSFISEQQKLNNSKYLKLSFQYMTDSNQGCSPEDKQLQHTLSRKQRDANNKSGAIEELAFFKRLDMKIANLTRNSVMQFYFLKSTTKCKLLSGDMNTSLPVAKDYDESKHDNFVWHWENEKTLKNTITRSKISLETITCSETNMINQPNIFSEFPLGCSASNGNVLSISLDHCSILLKPSISTKDQQWQLIPIKSYTLEDIACPFFIMINTLPCTLLTGSKQGEYIRGTSYRESIKELQLWYWSNGQIINLNSGLALELIEIQDKKFSYHIISASPKDFEDRLGLNQLWTRKSNSIQSIKHPGMFFDFYKKDYIVHLSAMPKGNWSFIDFQDDSVVNSCLQVEPTMPSLCPCNNTFEYKSHQNDMLKQHYSEEQLWYWQAHHALNVYHHLIVSGGMQTV